MKTIPYTSGLGQMRKPGMLLLAALLLVACNNRKNIEKLNDPTPMAIPSSPTPDSPATGIYEWDGQDSTYTPPLFPGGVEGMAAYLKANLRYPPAAAKAGKEGRVYVSYVIDNNGHIADAWVVEGVTPELDRAAIQAIKEMPQWTPATLNGKPIKVKYTQPILFALPKPVTYPLSDQTLDGEPVYNAVEQDPTYPEGPKALKERTTIYQPNANNGCGIKGRIYIQFIVDKEGNVRNPQIVRGVDPYMDKEALKLIRNMPRWIPGKINGKPVNSLYTLPITSEDETLRPVEKE